MQEDTTLEYIIESNYNKFAGIYRVTVLFNLNFKILNLNACEWSARLQNVARTGKSNKICCG